LATFRSLDEISLAMVDFLRLVQPELDTKPGTVARDLFIDTAAVEISKLYTELRNVANIQSFSSSSGGDLDRLAKNYGLRRKSGSPATGTIFITTNDLSTSIFVPSGTVVRAKSGISFKTLNDVSMDSLRSGVYRANALRISADLNLAGITDQFAAEVAVEATQAGDVGNVGKFSVARHSIPGISNVLNVTSMTGGSSVENDTAFRARVLAVFAGSNIGTALGYASAALKDARVKDAVVVSAGDPLMVRDGTVVEKNENDEEIVVTSGTGGKVDIYVNGSVPEQFVESFIYRDQSGKSDPTDAKNSFILGQRSVNPLLDLQQKKKLLIEAGTLPFQPVEAILSISGSESGPHFRQKATDSSGNVVGNFELQKDDGAFAGSVFGFDKIHFIKNSISLSGEPITKATFNGQDPLEFTDIKQIDQITQDTSISDEHPAIDPADRSILTLGHFPVTTLSKVENVTTGERYTVTNSNVDGGEKNRTGRVKIAGATLPAQTDILQVNYTWEREFDPITDFDSLNKVLATRTVQDSIDWGFANRIIGEEAEIFYDDGYKVEVSERISRVINVNLRREETVAVSSGKIIVSEPIINLMSATDISSENEVFYTAASDGSVSGSEITLPTDAGLTDGTNVLVIYNVTDCFSPDGTDTGSFSGELISLSTSAAVEPGETVYVDYVADVATLIPTMAITSLPAVGDQNEFIVNEDVVGSQPVSSLFESDEIVRNLRFAPTYLKIDVQGISAPGRLTLKGTSFSKVDTVMVVGRDGLQIDVSDAIKSALSLSQIASTVKLALVEKVEKVAVDANGTRTLFDYNLKNYRLKSTEYSNNSALPNDGLTATTVEIQQNDYNLSSPLVTGELIHVVLYIVNTNEVENITVSTSTERISKHRYVFVEKLSLNSGFANLSGSIDGTILVSSFTQPDDGTGYSASYSYVAPKEGERLTVTYNYNRLITDATFAVEKARSLSADVLVKSTQKIPITISAIVTIASKDRNSKSTIQQQAEQVIVAAISSLGQNAILDASDITNIIYRVAGVDAVEISAFNLEGKAGKVKSLKSGKNKFFTAGTVSVEIVER
jgi:uncharacterized phage protein gp47/JayE